MIRRGDMGYLYLVVAIVSEVVATSSLAASEGLTRPAPTVIMALGYAIAFVCLAFAVRTIPVAIAYALWSGIGIALISIVGVVALKQRLDTPALIGLTLIVAGVIVLQACSQSRT